jgi:hypothetical protein
LNTLPEPEHKPRIFLCHAKEDKPRVKELYHQPKAAGYHPWLDEEDLLPGQDWELEIRHAIRGSDFFLACLSEKSVDKRGYVQKELKLGLDELDRMPEGNIYLIPVRLERCQVPERLQSRQWVDLFLSGGFERLRRALDFQSEEKPAISQRYSLDFQKQALNAVKMIRKHHNSAHRGAFLWYPEITAVFENRASHKEAISVDRLREALKSQGIEELSSNKSDDGETWVILVDSSLAKEINDLVWSLCPGHALYIEVQKEIAFERIWQFHHRPVNDTC